MSTTDLPLLNAVLNGIAATLLVLGLRAIKAGQRQRHLRLMLSAFGTSAVFLASYLTYHAIHGSKPFPEALGGLRTVYLVILVTHVILAVVNLPFIVTTLWRAYRGEFQRHKKIAKLTWASWMYVSVTGVVIYLMLYQLAPRLLA